MTVPLSTLQSFTMQEIIITALSVYGATIVAIIWRVAVWKTKVDEAKANMDARVSEVEKRVREFSAVRAELDVIKNDIKWIRETMEREQKH